MQVPEVTGSLNLTRIKAVSGGEDITASYKGKHLFEFTPEFKLLLIGNEPPSTRSVGRELQRRFHVREFHRIENPDVTLAKALQEEAAVVLGWAIDGAIAYYKSGIHRSSFVKECTHRYFADYDFVQQFIEDCCEAGPEYRVKAADIYFMFREWCEQAGWRNIIHRAEFTRRLVAKGFEAKTCVVTSGQAPDRGFSSVYEPVPRHSRADPHPPRGRLFRLGHRRRGRALHGRRARRTAPARSAGAAGRRSSPAASDDRPRHGQSHRDGGGTISAGLDSRTDGMASVRIHSGTRWRIDCVRKPSFWTIRLR